MVLKYKKVAFEISNKIINGDYTDKLPSEAKLVEQYHASRNTIRNAMDALFEQGMDQACPRQRLFRERPLTQ